MDIRIARVAKGRKNAVKMFGRMLKVSLVLFLAILFGAVVFRIVISERYPSDTVRFVATDAVSEYYEEKGELIAYTQELRTPYENAKNGKFSADGLIVIPDASHLQVTVRNNNSAMKVMAEEYKLDAIPSAKEGVFRYTLSVKYNGREDFVILEPSYRTESTAYMYRYTKLAFDGVSFDNVAYMRVDIYYEDRAEAYGHIPVYETTFEYDGELYPYESEPFRIPEEDLPK